MNKILLITTITMFCLICPAIALDLSNVSDVSDLDLNNGTYTKYWMSGDDGFDMFGFAYSLAMPFIKIFGVWFFAIIWFAYLARTYMKTGSVTMPVVIGVLTATVWGAVMPPETQMVGQILLGMCVAAIIVKLLVPRL